MLHYLTIGFLDASAVLLREVIPHAPLSDEVLALIDVEELRRPIL